MPLYPFTSGQGGTIDRFYHMKDAPPFGAEIVDSGIVYVRRPVVPNVSVENTCVVASSLPRWDKRARRHTETGKPAFESKNEIKEYQARAENEWMWD